MVSETRIAHFDVAYQREARELIVAGLGEHFRYLDPTLNPDLDDIARFYGSESFLLAFVDNEVVGTGAILEEDATTFRIVRMSVENSFRRCGIGAKILDQLISLGELRGYERAVLETTLGWNDATSFYLANGFRITDTNEELGEVNFERWL